MALFGKSKEKTPGGSYDQFIDDVMRHSIKYIESKHPFFTFIDAFKNIDPYIQRDHGEGQQVLDPHRQLNIELLKDTIVIYVPDPDTAHVTEVSAAVLGSILEVEPTIRKVDDIGDAKNLTQVHARTPGKIYEYNMGCYSHVVPSPDGQGAQVPGTHIALSFNASLPSSG